MALYDNALILPGFPHSDEPLPVGCVYSDEKRIAYTDEAHDVRGARNVARVIGDVLVGEMDNQVRIVTSSQALISALAIWCAAHDLPAVASALRMTMILPASSLVVCVDEALGRKFPDYTGTSFAGWVQLCGAQGSPDVILAELADHAGQTSCEPHQMVAMSALETSERYLVRTVDRYKSFASAQSIADQWIAMYMADPRMRDIFGADGSVIEATVTELRPALESCVVHTTGAIKIKSGKDVVCLDGGYSSASAIYRVLSVIADETGFTLTLKALGRTRTLPSVGQTLTLMENPFIYRPRLFSSKWTQWHPERQSYAVPDDL